MIKSSRNKKSQNDETNSLNYEIKSKNCEIKSLKDEKTVKKKKKL